MTRASSVVFGVVATAVALSTEAFAPIQPRVVPTTSLYAVEEPTEAAFQPPSEEENRKTEIGLEVAESLGRGSAKVCLCVHFRSLHSRRSSRDRCLTVFFTFL